MVFVAIGVMIGVDYMLRLGASDGAEAGAPSSVLSAPLKLILVSLVLIGWNRWRVRRRSFWQQYAPGAMEPNLYQVLDEGFYCENTRGQSLNRWTAVERLLETKDYLYVMTALRNGHVLPKRCFTSPEDATAFAGQIRQRLVGRAAQGNG